MMYLACWPRGGKMIPQTMKIRMKNGKRWIGFKVSKYEKKVHTYFETTMTLETMKLIKNLQRKKVLLCLSACFWSYPFLTFKIIELVASSLRPWIQLLSRFVPALFSNMQRSDLCICTTWTLNKHLVNKCRFQAFSYVCWAGKYESNMVPALLGIDVWRSNSDGLLET